MFSILLFAKRLFSFCSYYYFLNLKAPSRDSAQLTWKQQKISQGVKKYLQFYYSAETHLDNVSELW